MDVKKLPFTEQLLSRRRKVVSGFGLGVGLSLVVLVALFLNNSLKIPTVLQGLDRVGANSSFVERPLSQSSTADSSSSNSSFASSTANATSELQNYVDLMRGRDEGNVSGITEREDLKEANGEGRGSEETHLGNFTESIKNGGFATEEANGSVVAKTGDSLGSDGVVLEENNSENFSETKKNGSVLGQERNVIRNFSLSGKDVDSGVGKSVRNSSILNNGIENNNVGSFSYNGGRREGKASEENHQGNLDEKKKTTISTYRSQEACDIFDGRWVRDNSKPYYPPGSCPYIDKDFDCHLNGRSEDGYVKWKWQPNGCDIPSFNATDFLERLRGKRLVFVGDSLNRNMWESMVCMLRHSVRNKARVHEISGKREFKKGGFYAFRFEDYNCSVDFVSSPFLVRESSFNGRNGSFETLRLDLMDRTTSMYHDAEVVVFNTGHWWTHEKTSRGEDYYQEGNHVHPRLKVLEAYKRALTTWARWINKNIDGSRTQVFFRGYSVTHFRGGQWNSGGQCHKEIEPIFNETYLAKYPSKMRALEHVLRKVRSPVVYLNLSRLTDYRKDGHPSIYRMEYKTVEEQIAAERSQDCSHWCLPGVPDTWNELLYASLLKIGRGSWKN